MKNIKKRIEKYIKLVTELNAEYYKANNYTFEPAPVAMIELGKRYAKVVTDRHVHTFIDLTSGDILKAASWHSPVKNGVRENIFTKDYGRSCIDQYGAKYLK